MTTCHSSRCCPEGITVAISWCQHERSYRVVATWYTGPELWFEDIESLLDRPCDSLTQAMIVVGQVLDAAHDRLESLRPGS